MIEHQLAELIAAVNRLTEKLDAVANSAMRTYSLDDEQAAPSEPEAPVVIVTQPTTVVDVDRDALKSLCLSLIRADRSKKETIKSMIASFGATTIDNVPEAHIVELKAHIESLS